MAADSDSVFGEQAPVVDLLWGSGERPGRGPKPGLSVERIARAAIGIADAEGLEAVSMQRVAGQLGVTKMALYRYVPGKAELTALMVDTAIGEPPELDGVAGGWHPKLRAWAMRMWAALAAHPWALAVTHGVRVMGPNELGWMDAGVGALAGTGLDGAEQLDALQTVNGHVRGLAQQTVAASPGWQELTERHLAATVGTLLQRHGDRYPALVAAFASAAASSSQDRALEFGLDRILDGLGLLVAQRSGSPPAASAAPPE